MNAGNSFAMNDLRQGCAQVGMDLAVAVSNDTDTVESWPARIGRGRKKYSRGHLE